MSDRLQEIIDAHQGLDMGENMEWLVRELVRSRTAGDQLRAILDDLLPYARAGAGNHPDASYRNREVDRLASETVRLLGAIRSPDDAAQDAGGGGAGTDRQWRPAHPRHPRRWGGSR